MFETSRLSIEHLQPQHLRELKRIMCFNEKVMSTAFKGRVFSEEEYQEFIQRFARSEQQKTGFWTVVEKKSDAVIGFGGLIPCNYLDRQDFEFGFVLDDDYWGKGYGTEIGQFSIDYAKDVLQLPRVLAVTRPDNKAAAEILLKVGMNPLERIEVEERGERIVFSKDFFGDK